MPPAPDSLPDDVDTLKAMVIATQIACLEAEAKARNAEAEVRARPCRWRAPNTVPHT